MVPRGKDDLLDLGGVEEALRLDACALVGLGRALGEVVHAPVHVGVVSREEPRHRVDDGLRLLAGCRAVEVGERLAIGPHGEDRELLAHRLDVEAPARLAGARRGGRIRVEKRRRLRAHVARSLGLVASRSATSFSTRARSGSSGIRSTISRANA